MYRKEGMTQRIASNRPHGLTNFISGIAIAVGAVATVLAPQASRAQAAYPSRPVTLVVPYPAGGAADILARLLGDRLSTRWKQPVVIENRVGASGQVGTEYVGRATGDPYKLVLASQSVFSVLPLISRRADFNLDAGYAPITLLALTPAVLVVSSSLDVSTVKGLAALLKNAKPGTYSYSSLGEGTSQHLIAAEFFERIGVQAQHVPYKNSAQALAALASGDQIAVSFDNIASALVATQSGRVQALAVTSEHRLPGMPGVRTFAESGMEQFVRGTWMGLVGPPSIPKDIQDFISREVGVVMAEPSVQARLAELGFLPRTSTPEDFRTFVRGETEQLRPLIGRLRIVRE